VCLHTPTPLNISHCMLFFRSDLSHTYILAYTCAYFSIYTQFCLTRICMHIRMHIFPYTMWAVLSHTYIHECVIGWGYPRHTVLYNVPTYSHSTKYFTLYDVDQIYLIHIRMHIFPYTIWGVLSHTYIHECVIGWGFPRRTMSYSVPTYSHSTKYFTLYVVDQIYLIHFFMHTRMCNVSYTHSSISRIITCIYICILFHMHVLSKIQKTKYYIHIICIPYVL
jgi:hypothetical protein